LRHKGQDHAALLFFQKAYDLEPSPRTAAQLGLVELALGYALAAERHLSEALSSPNHIWVAKNRAKLETALADTRKAIATVEITGTPAGAEVLVNGSAVGSLPLQKPVAVAEGTVQIIVRAPGFAEKTVRMPIPGGSRERVAIDLVPASAATAGAAGNGLVAPGDPRAAGQLGQQAGAPAPNAWVRPAAWTASAVAAVAVGFGGWSLLRAKGKEEDFNTQTRPGSSELACDVDFPNRGPEPCGSYYSDGRSARTLGLVGLGIGALAAAGAVAGFLWSSPHREPEVAITPWQDGVAASWSTRF
jgi:hypothetical protein